MEMRIIKNRDGYTLCTPTNPDDLVLFMHCTNGEPCYLRGRVFDNGDVGKLLLVHGVKHVTVTDEPKEPVFLGHYFDSRKICRYCGHSEQYATKHEIKCFKNELLGVHT